MTEIIISDLHAIPFQAANPDWHLQSHVRVQSVCHNLFCLSLSVRKPVCLSLNRQHTLAATAVILSPILPTIEHTQSATEPCLPTADYTQPQHQPHTPHSRSNRRSNIERTITVTSQPILRAVLALKTQLSTIAALKAKA